MGFFHRRIRAMMRPTLLISLVSTFSVPWIVAQDQELGVDICVCSPTSYELTLDLEGLCPGTVEENEGISAIDCFGFSFNDVTTNNFVAESIQIIEFNTRKEIINLEKFDTPLSDGESIIYTSVSAGEIDDISKVTGGLQVNVFIADALNTDVTARSMNRDSASFTFEFTNNCNFSPILDVDDQVGPIRFTRLDPARAKYCSAVTTDAPSDAPVQVVTPTDAPVATPTDEPISPTPGPTSRPTRAPTRAPTRRPTRAPTRAPTRRPTRRATKPIEGDDDDDEGPPLVSFAPATFIHTVPQKMQPSNDDKSQERLERQDEDNIPLDPTYAPTSAPVTSLPDKTIVTDSVNLPQVMEGDDDDDDGARCPAKRPQDDSPCTIFDPNSTGGCPYEAEKKTCYCQPVTQPYWICLDTIPVDGNGCPLEKPVNGQSCILKENMGTRICNYDEGKVSCYCENVNEPPIFMCERNDEVTDLPTFSPTEGDAEDSTVKEASFTEVPATMGPVTIPPVTAESVTADPVSPFVNTQAPVTVAPVTGVPFQIAPITPNTVSLLIRQDLPDTTMIDEKEECEEYDYEKGSKKEGKKESKKYGKKGCKKYGKKASKKSKKSKKAKKVKKDQ